MRLQPGMQWLLTHVRAPEGVQKLQLALMLVLAIWSCYSFAQILWALVPDATVDSTVAAPINPAIVQRLSQSSINVELDDLLGLGLFGEPLIDAETILPNEVAPTSSRDGIENGAQETRLDLLLQGVLASSSTGLGVAVIEVKGTQANYKVGDKLPLSGAISLAKVMPKQVVIDNDGTYELLRLFEEGILDNMRARGATEVGPVQVPTANEKSAQTERDVDRSQLASAYRQQFYDNPQSLADVVRISAVRTDAGIAGYRVAPGRDTQQFRALGFKAGDVITAVNGLTLSDPANTVQLYQLMRDAAEASFDVDRNGTPVSISVSLGSTQ